MTPCFNEAGAKSAGKQNPLGVRVLLIARFNEAGAKSAGKPKDEAERELEARPASMRPAQKAPENSPARWILTPTRRRFNEAGAKSAGKLPSPRLS